MLTSFGKIMVYLSVILSIAGLGVSLWAVADKTDYKTYTQSLNNEINRNNAARQMEMDQLKTVLEKVAARNTFIPRGPDEIAANKDKTIAEALKEADDIEQQLKKIFDEQQVDITARINLINEMQSLREKLRLEKETGNALRLVMYPDPAQIREGKRSFRDTIASLQVAKEEVEKRTEAMQPDLYNAAIRLQNLQQRLKGLEDRAKELGIQ